MPCKGVCKASIFTFSMRSFKQLRLSSLNKLAIERRIYSIVTESKTAMPAKREQPSTFSDEAFIQRDVDLIAVWAATLAYVRHIRPAGRRAARRRPVLRLFAAALPGALWCNSVSVGLSLRRAVSGAIPRLQCQMARVKATYSRRRSSARRSASASSRLSSLSI